MAWWSRFIKPEVSAKDFVLDYERRVALKLPNQRKISDITFLVLDTETTGVDVKRDFILSFGAIKLKGNSILISSSKEHYLKSKRLARETIKVHGIVPNKETISREELIRVFLDEAGNLPIVGHHIGFDLAMLEKAGRSFGLKKIKNPVIDTLELGIRLEIGKHADPNRVNYADYSLDNMCLRYGIFPDDRHTAAGDAFLTAQLFIKLLKKARDLGIRTFGELMGV
nr:3'-5' exonuclease [Cytophagales bacterium]